MVDLSKSFWIKAQSWEVDPDELSQYFPGFLWILWDFALKLEDEKGNEISSKQYLENGLNEQKGNSEINEKKNRVRRLIKHFFKDRDCYALVWPVEDEKDIQYLD